MEEKLKRFKEALQQKELEWCYVCPCYEGCQALEEEQPSCEEILFLYVEHGETKNFKRFYK